MERFIILTWPMIRVHSQCIPFVILQSNLSVDSEAHITGLSSHVNVLKISHYDSRILAIIKTDSSTTLFSWSALH
jgi:hypothetical protein